MISQSLVMFHNFYNLAYFLTCNVFSTDCGRSTHSHQYYILLLNTQVSLRAQEIKYQLHQIEYQL